MQPESGAQGRAGRALRVAIVSSHPVPYHVPTYRALAARTDLTVEVLYTHDHGVSQTFDPGFGRAVQFDVPLLEGYPHRFLRNFAPKPGLSFTGQLNPSLLASLTEGTYDAVVIHGYQSATTAAALVAPRARRTKVLLRGESILLNPRSLAKRVTKQAVLRALFSRIDHFVAIGTLSRRYFEAYGVSPERITVGAYTVDNDYFLERSSAARVDPSAARRAIGLPEGVPLFLYCSKIASHKRPLDVLRAFDKASRSARLALAFVGDGEQMGQLRAEIARLGFEGKVSVLGFRNQSELPAIYGASDVFVQASEREPWGMVVNEAMASGMAILASDQVGSAYDLVRDNGAMFPVGDVDRLAALMVAWSSEEGRIARMKAASLARIAEWGPTQTADGIAKAVAIAVNEGGARKAS